MVKTTNNLKYLSNMLQKIYDADIDGNHQASTAFTMVTIDEELDDLGLPVHYDEQQLFSVITLYVKLSEDDINAAKDIDVDEKKLFLKKIKRVKSFFLGCMSGAKWNQVKASYLTQDYIDEIRMAATAIKASGIKSAFDGDFARSNINKLREIIDSIKGSDISDRLKEILCAELLALIHIFETYDVFGQQDAEQRVKTIIVELALTADKISAKDKKKLSGLFGFIGIALAKFRSADDTIQAVEHMTKFLGFGE